MIRFLVLILLLGSFANTTFAQGGKTLPEPTPPRRQADPTLLATMIREGPTERRQSALLIALSFEGWAPICTQAIFAYLDTKPTLTEEEYTLIIRGLARDLSPLGRDVDPKKVNFFEKVLASNDLKLQRALADALAERWQTRLPFTFKQMEGSERFDFLDPELIDFYWACEGNNGYEAFGTEIEICRPILTKLLTSSDSAIRKSSLKAIGSIADVLGTDLFRSDISGSARGLGEETVRWYLVQHAWEQFVPLIELVAPSLSSSDAEVRATAAQTMNKIALVYRQTEKPRRDSKLKGKSDGLIKPLKDSLSQLGEVLKSGNEETRISVAQTFENLAGNVPLGNALTFPSQDSSPFVRWISCRALGKSARNQDKAEKNASIDLLEKLLQDNDLDVRNAAIRASAFYGPDAEPKLAPVLFKIGRAEGAESKPLVIDTLGALKASPEAVMPLAIECLEGKDLNLRRLVARSLLQYGPAAAPARKALREALNDPDPELRKAAEEALIAIDPAAKPKL